MLAPSHAQHAWGSRGKRVQAVGLAAYFNYLSKKILCFCMLLWLYGISIVTSILGHNAISHFLILVFKLNRFSLVHFRINLGSNFLAAFFLLTT